MALSDQDLINYCKNNTTNIVFAASNPDITVIQQPFELTDLIRLIQLVQNGTIT